MSEAFRQSWIRQSAARQMLTILTYLCKQADITIPIEALEQITPGEVMVQSITPTTLTLRYSPPDTRMFVIDEHHAAERQPQPWQIPPDLTDPSIPARLAEIMGEPQPNQPLTTMDDVEAARREAAMTRAAESAAKSRILKGQPLPVRQPHTPPQ